MLRLVGLVPRDRMGSDVRLNRVSLDIRQLSILCLHDDHFIHLPRGDLGLRADL